MKSPFCLFTSWYKIYSDELISFLKLVYFLLLTYSMVQSPSWEADWFAASQKIPRISRNPKVHYRTHKRPPSISILCQPNPVHIPTSHLLEIHPNIIHPSTPRSPQWSLSLRLPHQIYFLALLISQLKKFSRLSRFFLQKIQVIMFLSGQISKWL